MSLMWLKKIFTHTLQASCSDPISITHPHYDVSKQGLKQLLDILWVQSWIDLLFVTLSGSSE